MGERVTQAPMTIIETYDNKSSDVECPACDRVFSSVRGMKSHHAQTHGESLSGTLAECDTCGAQFRRALSHLEEQDHHFCSEECHGDFRSEYYTGERNHQWSGGKEELVCNWCGERYTRKPSEADQSRFCSYDCKSEWQEQSEEWGGENHPMWNGGLTECECEYCGEHYEVKPKEVTRTRFCSNECKADWQSDNVYGPSHPSWRGGVGNYYEIVHSIRDEGWISTRERVLDRDGECQMCGSEPADRKLDVHHIVPILCGGCNADELLMALCRSCHRTVEQYTQSIPEVQPIIPE